MQQRSLFDGPLSHSGKALIGIVGSVRALTPSQRKFNQLIERLKLQRAELARWQQFKIVYQQHLADHFQPAVARLRKQQIAMVHWLDCLLDGKALTKTERGKVRNIITQLLSELLDESQDPELQRLYVKCAGCSFGAVQREELETLRELAGEAFGVDVDAYTGAESPAELAEWLEAQIRAASAETARPRRRKKKSAATSAREAAHDAAARGGTRAVREVFRKLVSELHPDREIDPAEQARKTELMQRVNHAYKAGDLLALLELQLGIEQIDSAALLGLAEEQMGYYIHVLDEQSRRLRDEIADFVVPFAQAIGERYGRKLTPELVQRALQSDIEEIHAMARGLDADLVRFRDVATFKRSLRDHQTRRF